MDERAYRAAEERLWADARLVPTERWVEPAVTGTRVRVLEVGEGDPVVFVHGGPNAASTFVPMLPGLLPGRRLLLVDRPGCGLSAPHRLDVGDVPGFGDRFLPDLLDELGVVRADVVASSVGGFLTLRAAAAEPSRFRSMVQLGCPAFAPGMAVPGMMRAMASPLRHLIARLPVTRGAVEGVMRAIGHGASMKAGTLAPGVLEWYAALQAHTDTNHNDGELIAACMGPVRGVDPSLTLDDATLAAVTVPTLFVWGADDTFGGGDVGEALVAAMPDARMVVLPDAGHLPWLDDPAGVARLTAEHLADAVAPQP